jgi:Lrp/AsnC family transcriptional regulator
LFAALPQLRLLIAVGSYAHAWHLGGHARKSLTERVAAWREIAASGDSPLVIPFPHPSWRNNGWLRKNPWFEGEVRPLLARRSRASSRVRILFPSEGESDIRFQSIPNPGMRLSGTRKMVDRLDRKILQILQEDATVPVAEIGRRVGLSTTPCWRRIQKLEEEGVIVGRVALLDPKKVNTRVTAFVAITTNQHNDEWLKRFAEVIRDIPRWSSSHAWPARWTTCCAWCRTSRPTTPSTSASSPGSRFPTSRPSFAMEQIKYTTSLPLSYIVIDKDKTSALSPPQSEARKATSAARSTAGAVRKAFAMPLPRRRARGSPRRSLGARPVVEQPVVAADRRHQP